MLRLEPILLHVPDASGEPQAVTLVGVADDTDFACGEALLADVDVFATAVDFFADAVAHTDPLDFNLTWQRLAALLDEYTPDPLGDYRAVLGAIDVALWDLAGRKLGAPCHRLAGGRRARRLDCVAGGLSAAQDDLAAAAERLREGFGAVEVRLTGDARRDVPAIHRVRRALGEQTPLMADAGEGYGDLAAAREVGEALEQVEAFWFENPLAGGCWGEVAELRRTLGTAVAGGRLPGDPQAIVEALHAEALDLAMADLRTCGGLTMARRLADMTHAAGVRMSLHGGVSPLAQTAAAHLAAAHWHLGPLQIEPTPPALAEVFAPPPCFAGGFLCVPDEPGLGCRFQEGAAARYRVELPDDQPA